jgi:hypothetical protein
MVPNEMKESMLSNKPTKHRAGYKGVLEMKKNRLASVAVQRFFYIELN